MLTIVFGAALVLLGIVSYLMAGGASVTALIPTFLGAPLSLLGMLALNESMRKHAMHGAVVIGLLGLVGSARGVVMWATGRSTSQLADVAQLTMFVLCGVFLALCVKSFINARRSRLTSDSA